MADTAISTEEIKENILKCDRCGLQFDSNERIPRMLPCQHSYCTNCLDDVWTLGHKLNCPTCSQQWDVRGSVADTFPVEFTAMKFVVYLELKSKKGRRFCTDCSEKTTATHHCLNCQVYICEEGLRAHKRFYKQKDHQILSIAEIMKLPENYLSESETCRLHPGSTLDLYCEKPSCMLPVCPSCAMIQHKERDGHEIRDLKEVVADEKKVVTEALDDLQKRLDQNKDEKSEIDKDLMYLTIESKRLESNIERYFNEFVRQAAEQKETLKRSLNQAVGEEREHMQACSNAFKSILQEQEAYTEHCRQVMGNPKVMRFLEEKEDMKQKLNFLVKAPVPDKPDRKDLIVDLTPLTDSMNKMAMAGDVVHIDHTAKQWKCVIEITDGIHNVPSAVARAFLTYVGKVVIPSKPPHIICTIEDSSGMTTRSSLTLLDQAGDSVSTRSDELDSPDASRQNEGRTRHSDGYSYEDSGYQHSGSLREARDVFDGERYAENISPTDDKERSYANSQASIEIIRNRQRSEEVASTDALSESERKNLSRTSIKNTTSKATRDDRNALTVPESPPNQRSRLGTYSKPETEKRNTEANFQLTFTPTVLGPHKLSFKVGGYTIENAAFTFDGKDTDEQGLDRLLHYVTWVGEEDVSVKSVKLPHISLSEDRLNTDQCTITNTGRLIKSPSEYQRRPGSGRFTNYCGTTGSRCFSGTGVYYWRVTCGLRVLAQVAAFGKMILEVALAHGDVLDDSYCVWETAKAWSIVVSICSTHKAICIKAVFNSKVVFDKPLMDCEKDSSLDLDLGILLDMDRRQLCIIDVQTGDVMWTFENLDASKSLWPVFGVYNRYHFRVEVGVVSGAELDVPQLVSTVIEEAL